MESFYPLISIASMAGFGWLGWRMATTRNRNPMGWLAAGALLPPLLLVLKFAKPVEAEAEPADESETDD